MLDAGWPADARNQEGATALHHAAWHGDAELARALLRRGASWDVQEQRFGGRPLGWAMHGSLYAPRTGPRDHAGVVEALLGAGAAIPDGPFEASDAVRAVIESKRAH
jgi:ankyrin repeat protein